MFNTTTLPTIPTGTAGQYLNVDPNYKQKLQQAYQQGTQLPWIPPSLPIKLTLREMTTLIRALDKDPDLKALISKFTPWMGVEV